MKGDLILSDGSGSLPSLQAGTASVNPAISYLRDLSSKLSRQTMISTLNCTARHLGANSLHDCNWSALNRDAVRWVIALLQELDYSPATIGTYRSAIRGVAREAWIAGLISASEFEMIKLVKPAKGKRIPKGRSLTTDEVQALLGLAESDPGSLLAVRDTAIVAIFVGAGLRRAEVAGLNLGDVLLSDMALKVRGKGNKERLAFLPNSLWKHLVKWIDMRGDVDGPLFIRIRRHETMTSDALSTSGVYHIIETRRKELGIEYFSPHDLRRTFASHMLNAGVDLFTLKDALGHENLSTTERYNKRGVDRQKAARDMLDYGWR